jgi:ABC-type nitrate/sulfonate/bicarbonate transport system substrate-binding protein
MMKKVIFSVLIFSLLLVTSFAFGDIIKVKVVLDWYPNTNHTGIYVAKELGFYKEVGLDVEISQPSKLTAEQLVAAQKAEFGISFQETVTLGRAQGMPIVSIAAIIQHNTSGFAARKEEGVRTPKDFEGKKYGSWGSPIEEATLKYIMNLYGADYKKVKFVELGAVDFLAATERDICDFMWIYYGWEGLAAKLNGIDIYYLPLRELSEIFDYYTPVIITNEKLIKDSPDIIKKFVYATAKGYEYAIEHPEEAAEILLKFAPELDEKLVYESQKWLKDQYKADAPFWGYQKREVWERYTKWLYEQGFIEEMIDIEKAFTNEFLPGQKGTH